MDAAIIIQLIAVLVAGGALWKMIETAIKARTERKKTQIASDAKIRTELWLRVKELEEKAVESLDEHIAFVDAATEKYNALYEEHLKLSAAVEVLQEELTKCLEALQKANPCSEPCSKCGGSDA